MVFTGHWEHDLQILECFLEDIDYKTATSRLQKFKIKRSQGGSVLMGYTYRGFLSKDKSRVWCPKMKKFETKLMTDRPDLWLYFEMFRDLYFRDFNFTGVQLNYNYKIGPHFDANNIGESVLVCCGDYTGGSTIVEMNDGLHYFDGKKAPVIFDGSKYKHWVEEFAGERYSLVFFNDTKN